MAQKTSPTTPSAANHEPPKLGSDRLPSTDNSLARHPRPIPRKILMTTAPFGDIWSHAMDLVRALSELNVEVALATMGGVLAREKRRELKSIPRAEVFEGAFKNEWMENPWEDLKRAGEWLLDLEQKIRPDVIHLNGCLHSVLPWHAPRIVAGHSCQLSEWRAAKEKPLSQAWARYWHYAQAGLKAADMVVASSRSMLCDLTDFAGPLNLRVIFNGRDPTLFKADRKEPFILTSGHLRDESKNLSSLASIAKELPWPVYVAGEQPPIERRRKGGLHLIGKMSAQQMACRFSKASIFALPARYETIGLSVLEAGMAGCALVLGDIPSLRETWNGAACFVDPDNPEHLKRCLKKCIDSPSLLRDWAALAQCRAIQFTPKEMGARYFAAYRELMSAHAPNPGLPCEVGQST